MERIAYFRTDTKRRECGSNTRANCQNERLNVFRCLTGQKPLVYTSRLLGAARTNARGHQAHRSPCMVRLTEQRFVYRDRFFMLPVPVISTAQFPLAEEGLRILLNGGTCVHDCFVEAADACQREGQDGRNVAGERVHLECSPDFLQSRHRLDNRRARRGFDGSRHCLLRATVTEIRESCVRIRHARQGLHVAGIKNHGLLKALERLRDPWSSSIQHGAALEILLIGRHVVLRDLHGLDVPTTANATFSRSTIVRAISSCTSKTSASWRS